MAFENSDGIWADDLLNRRADAEFLIHFLKNRVEERGRSGRTKSYVLNVDAAWGYGKSFFLRRLKRQLEEDGHLVAFVNAWEDDHAEDPLLSVMAAIDDAVKSHLKAGSDEESRWNRVKRGAGQVALSVATGAARHWGKKVIGDGVDAFDGWLYGEGKDVPDEKTAVDAAGEELEKKFGEGLDILSNRLLHGFRQGQQSIAVFKNRLKTFVGDIGEAGKSSPLFVLIDELDRCRPLYAIELLERVKHIFETDNLVFVIATDTDQLRHSVKAIYGAEFDSKRYLMRFFDRTYEFEEPQPEDFVKLQCEIHGLDKAENLSLPPSVDIVDYLSGCFRYFGLSLRDIEQCIDILRSIVTAWDVSVDIEVCAFVPLIVAYQQTRETNLSEATLHRLGELHNRNPASSFEWQMTIHERYAGQIDELEGLRVTQKIIQYARQPLPEIARVSDEGPWQMWIRGLFSSEFSELYNNRHDPMNPPYSIIRRYPEFIRSAGRLAQRRDGLNEEPQ